MSGIVLRKIPSIYLWDGFFLSNNLICGIIVIMNKEKLLKLMTFMIFFIFGLNFLAMKLYWYSSIWWFDMPMHFLGGFFIGLLGMYLFSPCQGGVPERRGGEILKLSLFILLIGISWEIFEIIVHNAITHESFNLLDTASDVFFDLSGGLSAIIYICRKN